ncbi:MAG: ATP synthase F1 subunit gamma [Bacteroidales bacterium]|nr:ATP synthase F1 subunit gamma [Bacteroidales bacterium]
MSSLKEIKGRIASVGSTLKITSAMKMVSSAKLRKAQNAIGNMLPYQEMLSGILGGLLGEDNGSLKEYSREREVRSVALVCFASNSSLCGAFNSNAVRKALSLASEYASAGVAVTVFSIGRKMSEAMAKAGYPSPEDYTRLSSKPSYEGAAALGEILLGGFLEGRFDKVEFVYNHYKSASSQEVLRQTYLPFSPEGWSARDAMKDYIIEPSREALVSDLLPKVLRLKVFTVLLDTVAAEHAARVVAMQTATDNANSLLVSLTLEYNKSRQQKITSEILDIVGGSMM